MALFAKDDKSTAGRPGNTVTKQPSPQPQPQAKSGTPEIGARLGQGARIEGKLTFKGSVQIDCEVDGEIRADDAVVLGETARITAKITAATVIASGRIEGDIEASKRIELKAPASIVGNLKTPSLVIHEGVTFEGRSDMGRKSAGTESSDKRVAIFPTEERGGAKRRQTEAAN